MLIRLGRDHHPRLEQPEDLRAFKLVIDAGKSELGSLQAAFSKAGRIESEQIAWVSEAWLRTESPLHDDPKWLEGFGKMVEYAKSKGWMHPTDGTIRAHIEWGAG